MNKTLLPIRVVFVLLCTAAGWLVCYTVREWDSYRIVASSVGFCIGALVVLVDVMLKGFSLRGSPRSRSGSQSDRSSPVWWRHRRSSLKGTRR
jgi:hypothetical protein